MYSSANCKVERKADEWGKLFCRQEEAARRVVRFGEAV